MENIEQEMRKLDIIENLGEEYKRMSSIIKKKKQMKISELEKNIRFLNPCEFAVALNISHFLGSVEFYRKKNETEIPVDEYNYSKKNSRRTFVRYVGIKRD